MALAQSSTVVDMQCFVLSSWRLLVSHLLRCSLKRLREGNLGKKKKKTQGKSTAEKQMSRAKSNKRPPKSKLRSGNYMPLTTACAKAGTRIRKIQRASESANAFGGLNIRRWEILWKTWSKVMERIIKTILDWVLEKKINNWLWLYCQYAVL